MVDAHDGLGRRRSPTRHGRASDAFVVVDGACPDDAPGGDLLIVNPPAGQVLRHRRRSRRIEHPAITSWENGDPRMRFLTLDGVHIASASVAQARRRDAGAHPHAGRARSRPTSRRRRARGRLLGFDVGDSDWPLKASFVLFVRNLLEQARAHRAHGMTGPARAGEPLRVRLPASATAVEVDRADRATSSSVSLRGGLAVVPEIAQVGFYHSPGRARRRARSSCRRTSRATPRATSTPKPLAADAPAEKVKVTARGRAARRAQRVDVGARARRARLHRLRRLVRDAQAAPRERRARTRPSARPSPGEEARMIPTAVRPLPALRRARARRARLRAARARRDRRERGLRRRPILARGHDPRRAPRALRRPRLGGARLGRATSGSRARGRTLALLARDLVHRGAPRASGATDRGPWRTRLGDLPRHRWRRSPRRMAATGPELGRPLDRLTMLVAIDRSRSIDLVPNAEQRITQELSVAELGMREDDRIGTIAFARRRRDRGSAAPEVRAAARRSASSIGRDGTDLAAAIRRALAEVPARLAPRASCCSPTASRRAATPWPPRPPPSRPRSRSTSCPLEQRAVPDVRVVALRAPDARRRGRADRSAPRHVVARAPPRSRSASAATASSSARPTRRSPPARTCCASARRRPARACTATTSRSRALDPQLDQAAEDNAGSAFVRVRGQAAALVLEGDAGQGRVHRQGARRRPRSASTRAATSGVPADLGGLAGYDLVVLSDIRASDLSPGQIDALASYVRDLGGGLAPHGRRPQHGPRRLRARRRSKRSRRSRSTSSKSGAARASPR